MTRLAIHLFVVVPIVAAFAWPPAATAQSDGEIGVVETAVRDVTGANARQIDGGDSVFHLETVKTGPGSAAAIALLDDSHLTIGADAEVLLDSLVYDPNTATVEGVIDMVAGIIHFRSSGVTMKLTIDTPTATIGVRGTEFDVLADDVRTEVAVQEGTVEVTSPAGIQPVTAGEVYSVDRNGEASLGTATSPEMNAAVAGMYASLSEDVESSDPQTAALTPPAEEVEEALEAVEQRNPGADLGNMLFLELDGGLVIIETLPELAPNHAEQVKALARQGAYDEARFEFVRRGYAAEIAFKGRESGIGSGQTIPAEITDTRFTRGIVGMSRPPDDPDGATGAFFIALGDAPTLNGQYTAWGRVLYGMDVLDNLAVGRPPANPDVIIRARTAGQILGQQ